MDDVKFNLSVTSVAYPVKSMVFKRAFDIFASTVGLIILSPFLLLIGLAIRLDTPGPVLYLAKRIGRGGEPFTFYKFRSMVVDADKVGPAITKGSDSRITHTGYILRRTKLDELPQLFNVLKGDMSLVGPRPEDPKYVALYTPEQHNVLRVRPGVTSPASFRYRNEAHLLKGEDWETKYIQEIMPDKLAIDLEYVQCASLWSDIVLIFQTVLAVIDAWFRMLGRKLE